MALIDEYKQAIKDVLDGRAPEAPRPSELPWTEDKLANFWAAAASLDMALAAQPKKFLVTLTPTSPDYSGTMDKTVAEINAAYEAGMEIVFSIEAEISGFNVTLTSAATETLYLGSGSDYKGFHATFIIESMDVMIRVYSTSTSQGDDDSYSTSVYSLTPAS